METATPPAGPVAESGAVLSAPRPDAEQAVAYTVRAFDLKPGDVLHPIGYQLEHVAVDEPGAAGRKVHINAPVMGPKTLPLNEFVTIQVNPDQLEEVRSRASASRSIAVVPPESGRARLRAEMDKLRERNAAREAAGHKRPAAKPPANHADEPRPTEPDPPAHRL